MYFHCFKQINKILSSHYPMHTVSPTTHGLHSSGNCYCVDLQLQGYFEVGAPFHKASSTALANETLCFPYFVKARQYLTFSRKLSYSQLGDFELLGYI